MKKLILPILAILFLLTLVSATTLQVDSERQTTGGTSSNLINSGYTIARGQQFVVGYNGANATLNITQAEMKLSDGGGAGIVVFSIYAQNATGMPSGNVLANGTLTSAQISNGAEAAVNVSMTTYTNLIQGGKYVLLSNYTTIATVVSTSTTGDVYLAGGRVRNNGLGWFQEDTNDLYFRLYANVTDPASALVILNSYNSTTYETATEDFYSTTFIPAGLTISQLNFMWNGTSYSSSRVGNTEFSNFTAHLESIPLGAYTVDWYWNIVYTNGSSENVSSTNQVVSPMNITLCNSPPQNETFLNITFKDESTLSYINASIPLATFEYYLGSGSITKSYSFINNSLNPSYGFCFTPITRTAHVVPFVQYKQGTAYPQRTWSPILTNYSGAVDNQILYLLGASDGLYVTFQVVNPANQVISDVLVTINRSVSGSNVVVGQGLTGADGTITFWLSPEFEHTITLEKTGFSSVITSITPTQSTYTIIMGGGTSNQITDYTKGINIKIYPAQEANLYNHTTYNFNMTISSNFWDLDAFGLVLRLPNGTILGTSHSTVSSGGFTAISANTFNYTRIAMDYHWVINGTNLSRTTYWNILDTSYSGWSITYFFTDLQLYISSGIFGLDAFGLNVIIYLIMFISIGILSYKYGMNNPIGISLIIFAVVYFFDVTVSLLPNVNGIPNFFTFLAGLIVVGVIFKEVFQ